MKKSNLLLIVTFLLGLSNVSSAQSDPILKKIPVKRISNQMENLFVRREFRKTQASVYTPQSRDYFEWNSANSAWDSVEKNSYTWHWDGQLKSDIKQAPLSGWTNSERVQNTFDSQDRITESLIESWNGSAWENNQKTVRLFDAAGNIILDGFLMWNGLNSMWDTMNAYRNQFQYDVNGKMLSDISVEYVSPGNWHNSYKDEYTYDANGDPVTTLSSEWDTLSQTWIPSTRSTSVFNAQHQVTEVTNEEWNGSGWDPQLRLTNMVYDPVTGRLSEFEIQFWMGFSWMNALKSVTTFDANGGSETIDYIWGGNSWTQESRTLTQYDAFGHIALEESASWNGNSWDIQSGSQYTHTLDGNHNPIETVMEEFDMTLQAYIPSTREVFGNYVLGREDITAPENELKLWPNPVVSGNNVNSMGMIPGSELAIFDTRGSKVLSLQTDGNGNVLIPTLGLPAGFYVLKAEGKPASRLVIQ